MTRKEAISKFRELWGWIAAKSGRHKFGFSKWKEWGKMTLDCPLCQYTPFCSTCPIEWPGGGCVMGLDTGLYSQFNNAFCNKEFKKAQGIAKKISELSEKKEKP